MEKYIKALTALNNVALKSNPDELDRFAESDVHWANNKNKTIPTRKVKKGNIYQFEFGKNYMPVMSYEHRGLVIGVSGKLLYVLPIFSFDPNNAKHLNAYHQQDNPNRKADLFLMKASEFGFLKHDSVLKLNDIRTVSFLRIKYKQSNGFLDPKSTAYQTIIQLVFEKYFYNFAYNLDALQKQCDSLVEELKETKDLLNTRTKEYESLKAELLANDQNGSISEVAK